MERRRIVGAIPILCALLVSPVLAPGVEAAGGGMVFTTQVVAGTVGGALLGLAGFWAAARPCLASAEGLGVLGCVVAGAYGYLIGVPLGATLGVSLVGLSAGIEGNTALAALGAMAGEAFGIGVLSVVYRGMGGTEGITVATALGFVPFASAVGAAMGYNADVSPGGIGLARTFTAEVQGRLLELGLRGLGF